MHKLPGKFKKALELPCKHIYHKCFPICFGLDLLCFYSLMHRILFKKSILLLIDGIWFFFFFYHGHVLSSKVLADANKGYPVPLSLVDIAQVPCFYRFWERSSIGNNTQILKRLIHGLKSATCLFGGGHLPSHKVMTSCK